MGKGLKTSLADGRVLRSGIWQRPFKPHTVLSNPNRGARPSECVTPQLPNATPKGDCCCASSNVPSEGKTQLLSISCCTNSFVRQCHLLHSANLSIELREEVRCRPQSCLTGNNNSRECHTESQCRRPPQGRETVSGGDLA